MTAARNMVRALRDAGVLDAATPAARQRRLVILVLVGTVLGAMIVALGALVMPHLDLGHLGSHPAPLRNFVKPRG
jgi:hypothetical protein